MDRLEYLRASIVENTCSVQDLREYCLIAFNERPGMTLQDPNVFIPDDAMQAFHWLKGWWKPLADTPKNLELNLLGMLWAIYVQDGARPMSLTDKVLEFYNRALAYFQANGIDPNDPQETAEERKRRKQRDRMARIREERKVPEKDLTDDTRARVRALEAEIAVVKQNAKVADDERKQDVLRYQQLMIEASDARKSVAEGYKEEIARLRAEIKNVTAKQ